MDNTKNYDQISQHDRVADLTRYSTRALNQRHQGIIEMRTITVPANADLDDCLAGAVSDYVAAHPDAAGWDLSPRWADEARESVELTVPCE